MAQIDPFARKTIVERLEAPAASKGSSRRHTLCRTVTVLAR